MTTFTLYDSRYLVNPDHADILESCKTLKEAKNSKLDYPDSVIVKEVSERISEFTFEVVQTEIIL